MQRFNKINKISKPSPRRLALVGATVVLVGAGGGAALAAERHGPAPRDQVLADAAQRLGVNPATLRQALDAALADRVDAALRAGRVTKAQADEMKARIKQGLEPSGPGPARHSGQRPGRVDLLKAAADYLGLTPTQMRQAHQQGQTLAELAQQQGKTVAGLEQAVKAAAQGDLDQAVKAGKLTAAEEQQLLDRLSAHLDGLVNGQGPGPSGPRPGSQPGQDGQGSPWSPSGS